MTTHPLVREPQQERSRQSFDRAVDAAVALLAERGTPSFTLAEVARASGVSIGSMYGRVASKDDLIRVAHAREMERLSGEEDAAFAGAPEGAAVAEVVAFAVRALADLLQRNATVLRPFMLVALHDPVVAGTGKAAYLQMNATLERVLASAAGVPTGARGRRAVTWSAAVAYGVLARQLGLGNDPGAAADFDLDEVVTELTLMITAYLSGA